MKILACLFIFLSSLSSASADIITGQTKQIIHMNTGFNGTDLTVFGTLQHQNMDSVSLEILGPVRDFKTLHTKTGFEETISAPSFYAGQMSENIPSFDKIRHSLKTHRLFQPTPKIEIQDKTLFWSKIFLPADAPVGEYTIKYKITNKSGREYTHQKAFTIQAVGLQHMLYRLAVEYPLLNAILVIVSATFISHIIRFAMRKN